MEDDPPRLIVPKKGGHRPLHPREPRCCFGKQKFWLGSRRRPCRFGGGHAQLRSERPAPNDAAGRVRAHGLRWRRPLRYPVSVREVSKYRDDLPSRLDLALAGDRTSSRLRRRRSSSSSATSSRPSACSCGDFRTAAAGRCSCARRAAGGCRMLRLLDGDMVCRWLL